MIFIGSIRNTDLKYNKPYNCNHYIQRSKNSHDMLNVTVTKTKITKSSIEKAFIDLNISSEESSMCLPCKKNIKKENKENFDEFNVIMPDKEDENVDTNDGQ